VRITIIFGVGANKGAVGCYWGKGERCVAQIREQ
jgi:hypothetical protein